jgi:N6-L-threonylcarbamoyladenine synthase
MIILGIESSCDDTSVALVKASDVGFEILAEKTASQIDVHKKYGGVVPEIAGRCHAENISPLIEEVVNHLTPPRPTSGLVEAGPNPSPCKGEGGSRPDVIAVTSGPGLITGLLVGVEAAKTLSYLWNVPIVSVNHIEGHIHSVELQDTRNKIQTNSKFKIQNSKFDYPALALIASGGHTELILMEEQGQYKRVGATKDDAAGECFDKVAKLIGFDYPGGPKISKFAEEGNISAIRFPRPMLAEDNLDFSFAGLKTSALYWLRDHELSAMRVSQIQQPAGIFGMQKEGVTIDDFCASFEQAIIDVLVGKTLKAVEQFKPKTVILGGGVAANKKLRETLQKEVTSLGSELLAPNLQYAMDNSAMIAVAGYYKALKKDFTQWDKLIADPNWRIA